MGIIYKARPRKDMSFWYPFLGTYLQHDGKIMVKPNR